MGILIFIKKKKEKNQYVVYSLITLSHLVFTFYVFRIGFCAILAFNITG